MSIIIDDIWTALFTDYIKPHDYHSILTLSTVCRDSHRIFRALVARYVNVYGREVYCGDRCKNVEMFAGHTRHGIVRMTELSSVVDRINIDLQGCHYVQIRFLGEFVAQGAFNYISIVDMSLAFRIYLSPRNNIIIGINTAPCMANQVDFIKNDTRTSRTFRNYKEIPLILQNNCSNNNAITLWNIFLGLQDTTRFIETMNVG